MNTPKMEKVDFNKLPKYQKKELLSKLDDVQRAHLKVEDDPAATKEQKKEASKRFSTFERFKLMLKGAYIYSKEAVTWAGYKVWDLLMGSFNWLLGLAGATIAAVVTVCGVAGNAFIAACVVTGGFVKNVSIRTYRLIFPDDEAKADAIIRKEERQQRKAGRRLEREALAASG